MADGYEWYKKLADLMSKPAEPLEEYGKVPIDSWMRMIGFKRGGTVEDIFDRSEAARKAAELTESKLRAKTGY